MKVNLTTLKPEIAKERKDTMSALNVLLNFLNIPFSELEPSLENAIKDLDTQIKRDANVADAVCGFSDREHSWYLSTYDFNAFDKIYEHMKTSNKTLHSSNINSMTNLIFRSLTRLAELQVLENIVDANNESTLKAHLSVKKANQIFSRYVETHLGWNNKVTLMLDDNKVGTKEIGSVNHGKTADVFIGSNWDETVGNNGISTVDIAGKKCITLCAELVEQHELVDDGVKLYTAKVMYTKVPRSMNTWRLSEQDFESIVNIEDRVIAVEETNSNTFITTGKDLSWAIRTMKGRMMKKALRRALDI